jgi:hypothetical protein
MEKVIEIRLLSDIIPAARIENAKLEAAGMATPSFFLGKLYPGQLYSIVGMTNSGKTWWSLGTAISLAREGKRIGYITTEDTTNEIASYLEQIDASEESISRIEVAYIEDVNEQEIRDLVKMFHSNGCDIVMIDYLRPDILTSHHGDLNLTMGKLFKVLRGLLETIPITIIQTIQANAALYNKGLVETFQKNPDSLLTMIDGGYTAAKRSQVLGIIVQNDKQQKGVLVLKAKHHFKTFEGNVFVYDSVRESDFTINYDLTPVDFVSFMAASAANVLDKPLVTQIKKRPKT